MTATTPAVFAPASSGIPQASQPEKNQLAVDIISLQRYKTTLYLQSKSQSSEGTGQSSEKFWANHRKTELLRVCCATHREGIHSRGSCQNTILQNQNILYFGE